MKLNAKRYLIGVVLSGMVLLLYSCTTIKIHERDAFDAKKTVTPNDFREKEINIEEISFNSDDTTTLRAWYLTREDARGTVLYLGGNGFLLSIAGDIVSSIFEQQMNVFAFDYRGYGQSTGNPSVKGLKRDAQAAYNFLINQRKVKGGELIIHGHSLGTIFALWLANENAAAGLTLESPITDAKDLTSRLVPFLIKPFVSFEIDDALLEESNIMQIADLQIPLLILTGSDDNVTPKEMAELLYDKAGNKDKKLFIIEKGGHNDLPLKIPYKVELNTFYSKLLGASPQGKSQK